MGGEGGVERSCLLVGSQNEGCPVGPWRWAGEPRGFSSLQCQRWSRSGPQSGQQISPPTSPCLVPSVEQSSNLQDQLSHLLKWSVAEGTRTSWLALRASKRPFPPPDPRVQSCVWVVLDVGQGVQSVCVRTRGPLSHASILVSAPDARLLASAWLKQTYPKLYSPQQFPCPLPSRVARGAQPASAPLARDA